MRSTLSCAPRGVNPPATAIAFCTVMPLTKGYWPASRHFAENEERAIGLDLDGNAGVAQDSPGAGAPR